MCCKVLQKIMKALPPKSGPVNNSWLFGILKLKWILGNKVSGGGQVLYMAHNKEILKKFRKFTKPTRTVSHLGYELSITS